MDHEQSPSSVMYAELKVLGASNHDAALILLDGARSFGLVTVRDRIESRTQLSRCIVHVPPGAIDADLFRDYAQSVTVLLERFGATWRRRHRGEMMEVIAERLSGPTAETMQDALRAYGSDAGVYRNAVQRIESLRLQSQANRAKLHLLLLIVTGCKGDPVEAVRYVERYTEESFESVFVTPPAEVLSSERQQEASVTLWLVRVVAGRLKGADSLYRLSPGKSGTEIGAFASAANAITDVDADVSRHHARIYCEDGHWYVIGLRSKNGTTVIGGDDKLVHVVEPPRRSRPHDYVPQPYEVFPMDTLCFGATTRFIVLPIT